MRLAPLSAPPRTAPRPGPSTTGVGAGGASAARPDPRVPATGLPVLREAQP